MSRTRIVKPGVYKVEGVKVYLFEKITIEEFKALIEWAKKYGR